MAQYYWSASDHSIGETPSNWTAHGDVSTFEIVDHNGENALELDGSNASRSVATFTPVTGFEDGEVWVRWQTSTSGDVWGVFRATGLNDMGTLSATRSDWIPNSNQDQLSYYDNGSFSTITAQSLTVSGGNVSQLRTDISSDTIRGRWWADGDSEPSSWDLSGTQTAVTDAGAVGVGRYRGPVRILEFGVGTNGNPAPKAPVSEPTDPGSEHTWETQADWDAVQSRAGVVTRAIGDHSADDISLGWDPDYAPLTSASSYWTFDEASDPLVDVIGGHDGTMQNGASPGAAGVLGTTAVDFDGNNDYVAVPNDNEFRDLSELTIGVWANFDSFGSWSDLCVKRDSGNDLSWVFSVSSDNRLYLFVGDNDKSDKAAFPTSLDTGTWYHFAVAWSSGDGARFYLNGEYIGSGSSTARSMPDTSATVDFGADKDYGSYTDGRIDAPVIFGSRLSSSEVESLYNAGHSGHLTTAAIVSNEQATELTVSASLPTNTSATATVYQDTSGSGSADNQDTITLSDGTNTYALGGFDPVSGADYWVRFDLESSDVGASPSIHSATIDTASLSHLFSACLEANGTVYDIPVYDVASVERDPVRFRDDSTGEVGAAKIIDHSKARIVVRHPVDGKLGLQSFTR